MSTGWDTNKLKKLKSLVGKGLSTAEIGRRLEMSKNAVVGKLNRLGWNLKATMGVAKKTTEEKKTGAKKSKLPISKKIAPVKPVVMPKATKKATAKVTEKKVSKSTKTATTKTTTKNTKKTAKTDVADKPTLKRLPRAVDTSKKSNANLAMHQRIIQHSLELSALKPNQCRWPIGDPDSENFHFCGEQVFVGKPYCYEHCKQAYQFAPLKKK